MALLLITGQLELWHVYLTQASGAICAAFQLPAFQASITQLVPRERLSRAQSLVQLADGLSLVVAMPLAGLLIGTIGLGGVVLLELASFGCAVAALLAVRFPPLPSSAQAAAESRDWRALLFEPLMREGGVLAGSVGAVIGTGPGRGIALMHLLTGCGLVLASAVGWRSPQLRNLERELPDLLSDRPAG